MIRSSRKPTAAILSAASLVSVMLTVPAQAAPASLSAGGSMVGMQLSGADAEGLLLASDTAAQASDKKSSDDGDTDASPKPAGKSFSGNVSWYGPQFQGKKTASGRPFDMNKLTCAHRTLPFGTKVLVENPRTGQTVIVEVIDRGPYAGRRVMDLSREAARRLGILLGGLAFVQCTIIPKAAK